MTRRNEYPGLIEAPQEPFVFDSIRSVTLQGLCADMVAPTGQGAVAQPPIVTGEMVQRGLDWYRAHALDDVPPEQWMRSLLDAALGR